jgi:hypothetical protein
MLAILAPIRQSVVKVGSEAGHWRKLLPQPAPCSTSLKYRALSAQPFVYISPVINLTQISHTETRTVCLTVAETFGQPH